jgi:hypothetical protein
MLEAYSTNNAVTDGLNNAFSYASKSGLNFDQWNRAPFYHAATTKNVLFGDNHVKLVPKTDISMGYPLNSTFINNTYGRTNAQTLFFF